MDNTVESNHKRLAELREKLADTGFFAKKTQSYFVRFVVGSALLVVLYFYTIQLNSWALLILASLGLALLSLQVGFVAHDAGHGATSRKKWVNVAFGHVCFTIVNGLGFTYWRATHLAHHQHCQDEVNDPDMLSDGIISLTAGQAKKKKGLVQYVLPFQAYYFWFVIALYPYKLRYQGFEHLFKNFSNSKTDLLMLLHYVLWLWLPTLIPGVGFLDTLLVYVLTASFLGILLMGVFSVNHLGMPIILDGEKPGYFNQQAGLTRNIRNHPIFDFFFGGLNSQIEHHLFPNAPSMNLRKGRATVKEFCTENGVNYHEESYFSSLKSVTRHLSRIAGLERENLKSRRAA